MNDYAPPPIQRNPLTHARHRREVFRQITLPLIAALLLTLLLMGLAVTAQAAEASRAADISLIWLIAPLLVVSLLFLVLLAAVIYGLMRLIGILPVYTRQAQDFFTLLHFQIASLNDKLTQPFIKLHGASASMHTLLQQARRSRKTAPREHLR